MFQLPTKTPHPLKKQLSELGIRGWQITKLTGTSQSNLSNMLNGVISMPLKLERQLKHIISEYKKAESGQSQQQQPTA